MNLSKLLRNSLRIFIDTLCLQLFSTALEHEEHCQTVLINCYKFVANELNVDVNMVMNMSFPSTTIVMREELNSIVSNTRAIAIIRFLKCILTVMGAVCTHFISSIISLLINLMNQFNNDEAIFNSICEIWIVFIKSVKDEKLGDVLAQSIHCLISYVEKNKIVVDVLTYLLISKEKATKYIFPYLPQVPDIPSLRDIYDSISLEESVEAKVRRVIYDLNNTSTYIQRLVVPYLKRIIEDEYSTISSWIEQGVVSDDMNHIPVSSNTSLNRVELISELFVLLIHRCDNEFGEDATQYVECLGLLGAIDPSRLSLTRFYYQKNTELDESELAIKLINKYLAIHVEDLKSDKHKLAQYCTQKILKLLVNNNVDIWLEKLENKQLISLVASFDFENQTAGDSDGDNDAYKDWLYTQCHKLADSSTSELYKYLIPSFGIFISLSQYIFPYLIKDVIVNGSDENRKYIANLFLDNFKSVSTFNSLPDSSFEKQVLSTLLSSMDVLNAWLCSNVSNNNNNNNLETFLNSIPLYHLAKASFLEGSISKTIMYYELYSKRLMEDYTSLSLDQHHIPVRTNERARIICDIPNNPLTYLIKIYRYLESEVDVLDSLNGFSCLKLIDFSESIIYFEKLGKWDKAQICHERVLQRNPDDIKVQLNILRCTYSLGHLQTTLTNVDNVLFRLDNSTNVTNQIVQDRYKRLGLLCSWRLGRFDKLENYLINMDFEEQIASALFSYQKGDFDLLEVQLIELKDSIRASLTTASRDSYSRVYPYLVKIMMVTELEQWYKSSDDRKLTLLNQWNNTFNLTRDTFSTREPIIALRRVLYNMNKMEKAVGQSWLALSDLARTQQNYQHAFQSILRAEEYEVLLPELALAKAQLMYAESRDLNGKLAAIEELNNKLSKLKKGDNGNRAIILYRMELVLLAWIVSSDACPSDKIIKRFNSLIDSQKEIGDGYFHLAKYLDGLLQKSLSSTSENTDTGSKYLLYAYDTTLAYMNSLKYGGDYINHSLPRLLNIIFNAGDIVHSEGTELHRQQQRFQEQQQQLKQRQKDAIQRKIQEEKDFVADLIDLNNNLLQLLSNDETQGGLPLSIWMRGLTQILSRMNHSNSSTKKALHNKVTLLLTQYPKHVMWAFSHLLNSDESRKVIISIITATAKHHRIMDNYQILFKSFIRFCTESIHGDKISLKANKSLSPLLRILPSTNILIPLKSALSHTNGYSQHDTVDIIGFEDEIQVMNTRTRPRRIIFHGSDGRKYPFLVKPKDDLRRDNIVNELSGSINQILINNPETRKRRLYIHSFTAIPLSVSCGIVEWIENTVVYKQCITQSDNTKYYSIDNTNHIVTELTKSLSKLEYFKQVLKGAPPVLYKWFIREFPDSTQWYYARSNFTKTCAVMSMVGWILGLGDRHTSNILLNCVTGDLIHIDLNLLFDIATTNDIPETVPFRLTMNMVDAMGITGYSGMFQENCVATLEVLRSNKDTLMNLVEMFANDPLVEYYPQIRPVEIIERKLKGMEVVQVDHNEPQDPLEIIPNIYNFGSEEHNIISVKAQVEQLIMAATDDKLLADMRPMWQPWI
jgi:hypothetical protein